MKSEYIVTILLTFIIGYLLYLVMVPFLVPIFWAIVFVIIFYPYYRWLLRRVTKNRSLASVIACTTIALFLIAPMALIGAVLANELFNLYQWAESHLVEISTRAHNSPIFLSSYIERYLGQYIDVSAININSIFANGIKEVSVFVADGIKGFIRSFAEFLFNLLLAFFSMYFLFKDCDRLLEVVKDLLPISKSDKERLLERTRLVISATVNGGVMVGAIQGVLGGLAFWFLGLSAPILWGFVMFIFSFLPSIGTALVWGPAAIYLLITGSYMNAIILTVWGTLVVGTIDNILRPMLLSEGTDLHPVLLFFSILGAVNVFGLIGVIAGPVIVCIGQAVIELYRDTVKKKHTWGG